MANNISLRVNGKTLAVGRSVFGNTRRQMQAMSDYLKRVAVGGTLLRQIGHFAELVVKDNFQRERGASGAKWKQLEPTFTQRDRARRGFPAERPILIRTGELFDAVTRNVQVSVSRDGLSIRPRIGSSGRLAGKFFRHNQPVGTSTPNPLGLKPIPGREFFYLKGEDVDLIGQLLTADMIGRATAIVRGRSAEGLALRFVTRGFRAGAAGFSRSAGIR